MLLSNLCIPRHWCVPMSICIYYSYLKDCFQNARDVFFFIHLSLSCFSCTEHKPSSANNLTIKTIHFEKVHLCATSFLMLCVRFSISASPRSLRGLILQLRTRLQINARKWRSLYCPQECKDYLVFDRRLMKCVSLKAVSSHQCKTCFTALKKIISF